MNSCPEGYTGDCYSRDYTQIDCDEMPSHSRCVGYDGLDGLMFCDLDPDADPCYDRGDDFCLNDVSITIVYRIHCA